MTEHKIEFNFKNDDDFQDDIQFVKLIKEKEIQNSDNPKFSFLEILLLMGLIFLVLFGVLAIFISISTSNNIKSESIKLLMINNTIKNLYESQKDYSSLNSSVLIASGAVPSDMINKNKINSFLGNEITVQPVSFNNHSGYSITYTNVEKPYCSKLVYENMLNFNQIIVNGILVKSEQNNALNAKDLNHSCNILSSSNISFQN